jgi:hypothetical protein
MMSLFAISENPQFRARSKSIQIAVPGQAAWMPESAVVLTSLPTSAPPSLCAIPDWTNSAMA